MFVTSSVPSLHRSNFNLVLGAFPLLHPRFLRAIVNSAMLLTIVSTRKLRLLTSVTEFSPPKSFVYACSFKRINVTRDVLSLRVLKGPKIIIPD